MRFIEIPDNGIIKIPIMEGNTTVGCRNIDLSDYPTIDPYKHGHWIKEYVDNPDPHDRLRFKCSICDRYEEEKEPYCNCGAKMDEIIEEE